MNQAEVETMAEQLGVKVEEVVEMETRFSGRDISLEPPTDSNEDDFSPIAWLTDGSDPSRELEQEQLERQAHAKLKNSLGSLDERSRRIIEARWLREDKAATLHELAAELGISAERVRQIEAKAMKKMRAEIAI